MRRNVFLIDQENVPAPQLKELAEFGCEVLVYVGEATTKLPRDLVIAMQSLGERGRYVEISGTGKNALDFHIAFQLGEFSSRKDECYFHVISKDSGFDPLLRSLKNRGFLVCRSESIAQCPLIKSAAGKTPEERVALIEERLKAHPKNRPQRENTLASMINSHFHKKLPEAEVADVIKRLVEKEVIAIDNKRVKYRSAD